MKRKDRFCISLIMRTITFLVYSFGQIDAVENEERQIGGDPATPVTEASEAVDIQSVHKFTAYVTFVTDYRSRGISQTLRQPAIQGGMDYVHKSGFNCGTFASNVDGTNHFLNNTSMEWDFYGGYKGKLFPWFNPLSNWEFNAGLLFYFYPGGKSFSPKNVSFNTVEYYMEISYKDFSIKLWQTLTDYYGVNSQNPPINWHTEKLASPNGGSKGSLYFEANWTKKITKKWTILIHGGYQTVQNYWYLNYADWRLTATRELDWFSIFFTYVGTNAKHDYYNVPDNGYHQKKKCLGAQGVVIGCFKSF